ncbi:MAG: hypothetical protein QOE36_3124 [Gaiellaceae bacterium]|nr:hypothetical protein [Gaiellaceae bacterium]
MSSAVEESIEVLAVEVAEPLLAPAPRLALSRPVARALALSGRFGVVWLPVFALVSSRTTGAAAALTPALALATVWFLTLRFAFAGSRPTLRPLGPYVASAAGTAAGLVAASALGLWLPNLRLGGMALVETAVGIFILSSFWEGLVLQSVAAVERVLVVGAADGGSELVEDVALAEGLPFEIVGVVDDERDTPVAGARLLGRLAELPLVIHEERPDLVVVAGGPRRADAFGYLLEASGDGFKVVGLPEFYEHAFGRVPVRTVTATWFMSVLHLYQRPYSRTAKRVFDVVVAILGLLATGWLFPILALLVKRTPGPVVYRQTRLGEGGKPFTIFKFRTMRNDAEAAGTAIWAAESDPRVTSVGKLLRLTRLDELPQLWNVLRGEMSIVGPRPERPEFLEQLQEELPFWKRRHLVKPGITGWAQVRRGYTSDASSTGDKLSYDLWYLRHRSLIVDLAICLRTFLTVATGSGAR